MTTSTRILIYRLLSRALLEIREQGYTTNDKMVFALADLFHNTPSQLERMERGELAPDDVMQWLEQRAQGKSIGEWLEHSIAQEAKFVREREPGIDVAG